LAKSIESGGGATAPDGSKDRLVLCGRDEEGELLIGGIGVATGYIHAPDLTAQVREEGRGSNLPL